METAEENMSIPLPDDLFPWERDVETRDLFGQNLDSCRGCGEGILPENRHIADGCPCNSRRGVNHGLVPRNTCTCFACDPRATGGSRIGYRSPIVEARDAAMKLAGKRELLEEIVLLAHRKSHAEAAPTFEVHMAAAVRELRVKYAQPGVVK